MTNHIDQHGNNHDSYATRASLLLRINAQQPEPKEVAWAEFHGRYAPIIAGFARKVGLRAQDVDDVIQDVMIGFYAASPNFTYDPAQGRFRGYLKTCTVRTINRRRGQDRKFVTGGEDDVAHLDANATAVEHNWNDIWEQEQLRRALQQTRTKYDNNKTFRAFEAYVLKGESAEQIAQRLALGVNSVHQAAHRIKRELHALLARLGDAEG